MRVEKRDQPPAFSRPSSEAHHEHSATRKLHLFPTGSVISSPPVPPPMRLVKPPALPAIAIPVPQAARGNLARGTLAPPRLSSPLPSLLSVLERRRRVAAGEEPRPEAAAVPPPPAPTDDDLFAEANLATGDATTVDLSVSMFALEHATASGVELDDFSEDETTIPDLESWHRLSGN